MRAILQAVSLPSRSVKKNMEAAERQFKSFKSSRLTQSRSIGHPLNYNFVCSLLPMLKTLICHLVDRKPGDIDGITDIFFEDFKNFPQTRELGEESA